MYIQFSKSIFYLTTKKNVETIFGDWVELETGYEGGASKGI